MCVLLFYCLLGFSVLSSSLTADTGIPSPGAVCDCGGVKGQCVVPTRCLTTLDKSDNQTCSVCEKIGGEDTICCTDCTLVEDTRKAVLSPLGDKILWKDGRKSRDQCLDYISRLPYKCRKGVEIGLFKDYNVQNQCHNYKFWARNIWKPLRNRIVDYPFQVRLGFVKNWSTLLWAYSGIVISERFVITDCSSISKKDDGNLKYISTSIKSFKESFLEWSIYEVKRSIPHPNYVGHYNSISLVETKKPIQFNENLLPACLPQEDPVIDKAFFISAYKDSYNFGDIAERQLDILSEESCNEKTRPSSYFEFGYNHTTHICGTSNVKEGDGCIGYAGEPLMVTNADSSCVYSLIGVFSYCDALSKTQGFTRVAPFVPWIESIVWP